MRAELNILMGGISLSKRTYLQSLAPAAAVSLLLMQVVSAQPSPSLPGAIINSNRDPFSQKPQSYQTTPQGDKSNTPTIQDNLQKPALDPTLTQKIHVAHIDVQGVKYLKMADVRAIVAPYENKDLSLQELQDNVADKLTKLYERQGYVTTLVFIPPQTIKDGTVIVKADEGIVNKIVYEDGRFFKRRAVMPRLDVKTGEIFDLNDLERSLRRINENPDLNLQATLRAGDNPGQTDIYLKPDREHEPFHLTPFFDNLGRPRIGTERLGFTANDNNVLGFGDTLYSNHAFSSHSYTTLNGYEVPIGPHGTKIGISQAYSHFDFHQSGVKLNGYSTIYTPYISQELYRTERLITGAELGFGIKGSAFGANDVNVNADRVRVLTPAINLQSYDRTGRLIMRHELGIGLDVLNATTGSDPRTSRPGAGSQFVRYTSSMVRTQRLPWSTYGVFKGLFQYTPDSLVSLEQFQVGGAATVRGYQEGRLISDSGFVLSGEWHVPAFFFPRIGCASQHHLPVTR